MDRFSYAHKFSFSGIDALRYDCWQVYVSFLKKLTNYFLEWMYHFAFPPVMYERSSFSRILASILYYIIFFWLMALLSYNSYHILYPLKVYKSVVFSVFTELCKHHHNKFRTLLSPPKETLCPIGTTLHILSL